MIIKNQEELLELMMKKQSMAEGGEEEDDAMGEDPEMMDMKMWAAVLETKIIAHSAANTIQAHVQQALKGVASGSGLSVNIQDHRTARSGRRQSTAS